MLLRSAWLISFPATRKLSWPCWTRRSYQNGLARPASSQKTCPVEPGKHFAIRRHISRFLTNYWSQTTLVARRETRCTTTVLNPPCITLQNVVCCLWTRSGAQISLFGAIVCCCCCCCLFVCLFVSVILIDRRHYCWLSVSQSPRKWRLVIIRNFISSIHHDIWKEKFETQRNFSDGQKHIKWQST